MDEVCLELPRPPPIRNVTGLSYPPAPNWDPQVHRAKQLLLSQEPEHPSWRPLRGPPGSQALDNTACSTASLPVQTDAELETGLLLWGSQGTNPLAIEDAPSFLGCLFPTQPLRCQWMTVNCGQKTWQELALGAGP